MPIIAELFPSQPPEWDDFSADPLVRMRKGMLITESINIDQRRRNEYTTGGPWRGASQSRPRRVVSKDGNFALVGAPRSKLLVDNFAG